jgi:hypothetical protein
MEVNQASQMQAVPKDVLSTCKTSYWNTPKKKRVSAE